MGLISWRTDGRKPQEVIIFRIRNVQNIIYYKYDVFSISYTAHDRSGRLFLLKPSSSISLLPQWNWCTSVFFPCDLFLFPNQLGRSIDVLIDLFFGIMITRIFKLSCQAYTTIMSASKVHWVDHFYFFRFKDRSSIHCFGKTISVRDLQFGTMSVIEIVSLACLFILFLIMFFVVQNHLVLMQLWQQRAERDIAMMYVQDRASPTPDTRLQPRVDEMAPIEMHVIPHQRGVLELGGNYIGTAIDIQRMVVEPSTFFHQRIARRPLPRENDE